MKKRLTTVLAIALALALLVTGCAPATPKPPVQDKYQMQFFGAFDTIIQLVGYAESEAAFTEHANYAQQRFTQLHQIFDRFNRYDGVNNIKSINDNAGFAPVKVDPVVIDLIELCREWYKTTDGKVDIAIGAVLEVWHGYMVTYAGGAPDAKLPAMEELQKAAANISMDDVVTDREKSTVYLAKEGMMLDLGAAAKGYGAELVADELYARGLTSFLISAGGNVVSRDPPRDGKRTAWGIGIQDPFLDPNDTAAPSTDVVFVTNESVVTSGDYQRFYMVGDRRVHHIINPDTLQPADYYRGLTVVHENSGIADLLSTSLFCMDYTTGRAFAEAHNLKVLWIFPDGRVEYTDRLKPQLRDRGGATAAIKK